MAVHDIPIVQYLSYALAVLISDTVWGAVQVVDIRCPENLLSGRSSILLNPKLSGPRNLNHHKLCTLLGQCSTLVADLLNLHCTIAISCGHQPLSLTLPACLKSMYKP